MQKVLVIGGSGFVGKELVVELRKTYAVRCLVRHSTAQENLAFLQSLGVELVMCKEFSREVFEKALSGVKIAIYLIGIIKETQDCSFEQAHYAYVQGLLQACKKKKVKKIVYFSALGADSLITSYFSTKWKSEENIKKSGLHYLIFRPSIMFGKGDKSINTFIRMMRVLPLVPYFQTAKMQPVFVGDVAKCVRISLQNRWNKIFEIAGKDQLTLPEIFRLIARQFGLRRLFIKIPNWCVAAFVFLPNPFLTHDQFKMLQLDNTTSFPAEKVFGFQFQSLQGYLKTYEFDQHFMIDNWRQYIGT